MGDTTCRGAEAEAVALQPQAAFAPSAVARGSRFVAADVGGTNARIALVESDGGRIEILDYRRYPCGQYPSLTAILSDFTSRQLDAGQPRAAFERMAIASAGVVLDGEVINSNLPWRISLHDLRDSLGLQELHVINDFAAAAHGTLCLDPTDSRLLTPGVEVAEPGPTLVVGPGTGLGAAICIPHPRGTVVLPTEAGMTAFAPGTEREVEILRWMQRHGTRHVSTEQLVSGPGLVNLYQALCELECTLPRMHAPAAISEAARMDDPTSLEAVLTFCALLGSVIGDLVVVSGARMVHVAGGIVPQLVDFLPRSEFRTRMVDKGAMRAVLDRVPVRLVENERLGVLGAANWYLQQRRDRIDP
jgi:glucokinase